MKLREYLKELELTKEGKPEQVKEGLDTFIGLWRRATEKGVVDPDDEMAVALDKVERAGGLYGAAE